MEAVFTTCVIVIFLGYFIFLHRFGVGNGVNYLPSLAIFTENCSKVLSLSGLL